MEKQTRIFRDIDATRQTVPLWSGIVGASSSGKTWSALRLATGIQRITGGDIYCIDTEARRSLHYADYFKFRFLEFNAPFGSADYLAAAEHCVNKGAKIVIIDSLSHEHEGPGGHLEQHSAELERLTKGDREKEKRMTFLAWVKPKQERRRFINSLLQMPCNFIFCFRAKEKIKPVKGGDPLELGWQPIAGEEFIYEQTVQFLLLPGSGGVPTWNPVHDAERAMIKQPTQFKDLFKEARPLDEKHGAAMALWAQGTGAKPAEPKRDEVADLLLVAIKRAGNINVLKGVWADCMDKKPRMQPGSFERLLEAKDEKKAELEVAS